MVYFFQFKSAHIGESLGREPQTQSHYQDQTHIPEGGPGIGFNPFVLEGVFIFEPLGFSYLNRHCDFDDFIL
jgi:hypothetical protein